MPWHKTEACTFTVNPGEVNRVLTHLHAITVSLLKNELHKCKAFASRHHRFSSTHSFIHIKSGGSSSIDKKIYLRREQGGVGKLAKPRVKTKAAGNEKWSEATKPPCIPDKRVPEGHGVKGEGSQLCAMRSSPSHPCVTPRAAASTRTHPGHIWAWFRHGSRVLCRGRTDGWMDGRRLFCLFVIY